MSFFRIDCNDDDELLFITNRDVREHDENETDDEAEVGQVDDEDEESGGRQVETDREDLEGFITEEEEEEEQEDREEGTVDGHCGFCAAMISLSLRLP
jgi:hypothetical protein